MCLKFFATGKLETDEASIDMKLCAETVKERGTLELSPRAALAALVVLLMWTNP